MKKYLSVAAAAFLAFSLQPSALLHAGTSLYGSSDFMGTNVLGCTTAAAVQAAIQAPAATNGTLITPTINGGTATGVTNAAPVLVGPVFTGTNAPPTGSGLAALTNITMWITVTNQQDGKPYLLPLYPHP